MAIVKVEDSENQVEEVLLADRWPESRHALLKLPKSEPDDFIVAAVGLSPIEIDQRASLNLPEALEQEVPIEIDNVEAVLVEPEKKVPVRGAKFEANREDILLEEDENRNFETSANLPASDENVVKPVRLQEPEVPEDLEEEIFDPSKQFDKADVDKMMELIIDRAYDPRIFLKDIEGGTLDLVSYEGESIVEASVLESSNRNWNRILFLCNSMGTGLRRQIVVEKSSKEAYLRISLQCFPWRLIGAQIPVFRVGEEKFATTPKYERRLQSQLIDSLSCLFPNTPYIITTLVLELSTDYELTKSFFLGAGKLLENTYEEKSLNRVMGETFREKLDAISNRSDATEAIDLLVQTCRGELAFEARLNFRRDYLVGYHKLALWISEQRKQN
ncbi:unnamed protein product [Caenorhabditis auriculariae]|uniref:Uncharacterized protein n=1 Tax=Caenorhabditis auriculariae TaxID=2777116 RepID=A0A8S1HHK1_9PELO|nr:unnamed protein product [Caenorhabditis auriculariae]